MQPIITVTFNPAIDKSSTTTLLIPEKKMYCSKAIFEPGGGGVNVARAIKKLGGSAVAVYLAGGHSGKKFIQLLDNEGIRSVITEIKGDTRENLVVLETATNQQYKFVMPGPEVSREEWHDCLNKIRQLPAGYIVVSGSLPPGAPEDIFIKLTAIAREKHARLVVDTSGEPLKQAVQAGAYLVKPSIRELCMLAGKEDLDSDSVPDAAREVISRWDCEIVVVSIGDQGAVLVTKDQVFRLKPPHVEVKGTVGAGDSMVAGIVLSLARGRSLLEALQYGVACGTADTMNPGTELCEKEDVEKLYAIIRQKAEGVCAGLY